MAHGQDRPRAQQPRSRDTERRILESAIQVLGEAGAEGLTTVNVSVAAGVAVGSIYRRFGSKEQLLLATQSEFLRRFEELINGRMRRIPPEAAADPGKTVEHVTRATATTFAEFAGPLRALLLVGLQNVAVYEDGHRASVRGGRTFAEILLRHRAAIAHPDPETAVDFAYRLVYATCSHRLIQGEALESDRPMPWAMMIDNLARTVKAYLLSE